MSSRTLRAQVSRKFFPHVAVGFSVRVLVAAVATAAEQLTPALQDARVHLNICDGLKFVEVRHSQRAQRTSSCV